MLTAIVAGAILAGSNGFGAEVSNGRTEFTLQGTPFHSTTERVTGLRTFKLSDNSVVALWKEGGKSHYAITRDGSSIARLTETRNTLEFQLHPFDPLATQPMLPTSLQAGPENELYVVQFFTQNLNAYRNDIARAGGEIVSYIPNNAYVVRLDSEALSTVRGLEYVRYIGNYEPAFRIDPTLIARYTSGVLGTTRYNILLTDKSPNNKDMAAAMLTDLGGIVHEYEPGGFLIEATLTPDQMTQVAAQNSVLWMDEWGPTTPDMDVARIFHGTNNLEAISGGNPAGYSGEGVVGMARDTELRTTHQEFTHMPPIVLAGAPSSFHGTAVYGIIFARGANPAARGVIPDAQGVFRPGLTTGATRYNQTVEAINNHGVVFETNSTGSPQITTYSSISAEMDTLIFDLNILVCQSQSNTGSQLSRPQAWAKNMVSVGGIQHNNTVTKADDSYTSASRGPASDGRLKPDLASFYDNILAPHNGSNVSYTQFGGTSGATPITCGHFGLIFQMWSLGVFNNTAYGSTVFTSKCNAMTAKAMMINTATQWTFNAAGQNLDRVRQGWGHAQIDGPYNYRDKMLVVDQSDVIEELETTTYRVWVPAGEPSFKATMVYRDLPGNPAVQAQHRVNDLTLRVVSPGGTVYFGNNGLAAGMWSTSGGVANTKDTVENVFVQNPQSGVWTVEVSAPDINGDTHPATPAVDADYALVVTGCVGAMMLPGSETLEAGVINSGSLADMAKSDNTDFSVRPGIVLSASQHPIRIIKEVQAPTSVGQFSVAVESASSSTSFDMRLQGWNWNTNSWVNLATFGNILNTDGVVTYTNLAPGDLVSPNNTIRVRVSYFASAPALAVPVTVNIDHLRVFFQP